MLTFYVISCDGTSKFESKVRKEVIMLHPVAFLTSWFLSKREIRGKQYQRVGLTSALWDNEGSNEGSLNTHPRTRDHKAVSRSPREGVQEKQGISVLGDATLCGAS